VKSLAIAAALAIALSGAFDAGDHPRLEPAAGGLSGGS